jgi:rhomboid family GlyGly-CTERM serine protease
LEADAASSRPGDLLKGHEPMHRPSSLKLNAVRRLPVASLLLIAFAVIVSLIPGVAHWLQYDRLAVAHGAFWRLVTSHFVHWSDEHLFWDVLALGVLGWMCEREGVPQFLGTVAAAALLIPLVLSIAEPQMTTYRGLSGIDSALFALLAARISRQAVSEKDWSRLSLVTLISTGFAAKIGFELFTGGTLFVDSSAAGLTPVPLAHVAGGLIGLAIGLLQVQRHCPRPVPCECQRSFS